MVGVAEPQVLVAQVGPLVLNINSWGWGGRHMV